MASSSPPHSIPPATPSQASFSSILIPSLTLEPFPFSTFFKSTYPDAGAIGPSGKRKTTGRVHYECLHCPSDTPWLNIKRDNAVSHAKSKHPDIIASIAQEDMSAFEHDNDATRSLKQRRIDGHFPGIPSESSLRRIFNRQQYNESIVGLLTRRRLPFSAVKWDELHDIVLAANPAIEDLLMTSRHEAMRQIASNFELYQSQLKAKLNGAISKIHIATDLWTSPHRHGILAVCARWVDSTYKLQRALLGLPECRNSHSGEKQAALIAAVLDVYGISKQIGYHTGDNATSNDTCLRFLSTTLLKEHQVHFLAIYIERHLPCRSPFIRNAAAYDALLILSTYHFKPSS
jgi:hypothetical protein